MWVIQEMALAKDGIFLGGNREATFRELFTTCNAMGRALGTNQLLTPHRPLLHVLTVSEVRHFYQKELKPLVTTLMRIHNTPRPVQATDTRGRIYGVLALANDIEKLGIIPDYTRSAKETYVDAARRIIYGGCPDILYFEQRIPGNQLGLQMLLSREMRSPSWVPDWGNDSWDAGLGEPFFASGSTITRGHLSDNFDLLGLDGILVDEVEYVDPKSSTFDIPWADQGRMQERLEEIADLCRRSKLYNDKERYEAQWRVPVIDWEQNDEDGQGKRATDVSRMSYEKIFGKISNFDLKNLTHADGASYSYIAHRRSRNRPFLSKKGYVGIGQLCVQPGDRICIFLGAGMPLIIRPAVDGTYLRIGSAFIHGMMDGEILNQDPKIEPIWLS